jgi:hypothetical protein
MERQIPPTPPFGKGGAAKSPPLDWILAGSIIFRIARAEDYETEGLRHGINMGTLC